MTLLLSNKPDAVNRAIALRLTIEDQWGRVTDLERWEQHEHGRILGHFHIVQMRPMPNNFVQATPVFAFMFVLSQVPGAPDYDR